MLAICASMDMGGWRYLLRNPGGWSYASFLACRQMLVGSCWFLMGLIPWVGGRGRTEAGLSLGRGGGRRLDGLEIGCGGGTGLSFSRQVLRAYRPETLGVWVAAEKFLGWIDCFVTEAGYLDWRVRFCLT